MTSDDLVPIFPTLPTDRLVLRPVRAGDVDALHARRNDPSTAQWQSWALPYPMSAARKLIDALVTQGPRPATEGWFQISVDDASTGQVIGDLALHLSNAGRTAEIGYTFAPEARGKGYATESATALVRWCFDAIGVSRVCARMHPDNVASARVAEQSGMVFEGHTRKSFWLDRPDGTTDNSDDLIYGVTDDSWRAWLDRPRQAPTDVRLVPIDRSNVHTVIELRTHRTQQDLVATNAQSIADASGSPEPLYLAAGFTPTGQVHDGEVIGRLGL